MPLRPMDKRTGIDSRQAVWEAIRRLQSFTARQLQDQTRLKPWTVRDCIKRLEAAGYLKQYVRLHKEDIRWRLVKDIGHEAPKVRKDGTPVTQGDGRKNMWEAMRIMRTFTPRELAVAASLPDCLVKESTAADYAKHLCHAGYLRKTTDGYMFLPAAYTGPLAPMVQRTKRVWDPNQQKVRWRSDEEAADDE